MPARSGIVDVTLALLLHHRALLRPHVTRVDLTHTSMSTADSHTCCTTVHPNQPTQALPAALQGPRARQLLLPETSKTACPCSACASTNHHTLFAWQHQRISHVACPAAASALATLPLRLLLPAYLQSAAAHAAASALPGPLHLLPPLRPSSSLLLVPVEQQRQVGPRLGPAPEAALPAWLPAAADDAVRDAKQRAAKRQRLRNVHHPYGVVDLEAHLQGGRGRHGVLVCAGVC